MSAEAAVDLHEQILDDEIVGTTHRTLHYFLPRFEDFRRARRLDASQTAVLDLGCGNGVAIELLRERGYRAVGIDLFPERYRRRRRAYVSPLQRFVQASALALPFADGSFDSVFSCGVLEHIGVEETYLPWVLRVPPDRADIRRHYLAECLRVLRPDGILCMSTIPTVHVPSISGITTLLADCGGTAPTRASAPAFVRSGHFSPRCGQAGARYQSLRLHASRSAGSSDGGSAVCSGRRWAPGWNCSGAGGSDRCLEAR